MTKSPSLKLVQYKKEMSGPRHSCRIVIVLNRSHHGRQIFTISFVPLSRAVAHQCHRLHRRRYNFLTELHHLHARIISAYFLDGVKVQETGWVDISADLANMDDNTTENSQGIDEDEAMLEDLQLTNDDDDDDGGDDKMTKFDDGNNDVQ